MAQLLKKFIMTRQQPPELTKISSLQLQLKGAPDDTKRIEIGKATVQALLQEINDKVRLAQARNPWIEGETTEQRLQRAYSLVIHGFRAADNLKDQIFELDLLNTRLQNASTRKQAEIDQLKRDKHKLETEKTALNRTNERTNKQNKKLKTDNDELKTALAELYRNQISENLKSARSKNDPQGYLWLLIGNDFKEELASLIKFPTKLTDHLKYAYLSRVTQFSTDRSGLSPSESTYCEEMMKILNNAYEKLNSEVKVMTYTSNLQKSLEKAQKTPVKPSKKTAIKKGWFERFCDRIGI